MLIIAAGSMGDVAPYTGLGSRLRAAGHKVAIAASETFGELVRRSDLEFRSLPGDPRTQQHSAANQRWQRGGGGALGGARLVRLLSEYLVDLGQGMIRAAQQGADLILLSGPAYTGGTDVAEGLGVPSMGVFAAPAHPTGDFPPIIGLPQLGRWGNRAAGRLLFAGMSAAMSGGINKIRASLGLSPRSFAASMRAQDAAHWPVYYGCSPTVVPRPSDWRPGLELAGYFWPEFPSAWRPPGELVDFLAAGSPPVFVGFGSMVPGDPSQLSGLVLDAARQARVRVVMQAGWAGLMVSDGADSRHSDVIVIDEMPHEWLFPRMAAIVHHCGAGTTAAALRAGVPTVPVPVVADQPFWASRQVALGVSPGVLPSRKLTADRLADALRATVHSASYRGRAGEVARRIQAEDGAGRVVDAIERLAS